jgi:uncharacterized protein YjbI with pentapeptide repeats
VIWASASCPVATSLIWKCNVEAGVEEGIEWVKVYGVYFWRPKIMKFTFLTADELIERYVAGERNFAGIRLKGGRGGELDGANFNGSNFSGAILHADMIGINLSDCSLRGADLAESDLSDAFLMRANFIGATLAQANLSGANLTDANLVRAELEEALVSNANLTGARLNNATGVEVDYWLKIGCIFCRTTMPDGTILNDKC